MPDCFELTMLNVAGYPGAAIAGVVMGVVILVAVGFTAFAGARQPVAGAIAPALDDERSAP